MICRPCGIAGDLIAVARQNHLVELDAQGVMMLPVHLSSQDYATVPTIDVIRNVAHLYHGLCTRCDCQHIVDTKGKMVDGEATRESSK